MLPYTIVPLKQINLLQKITLQAKYSINILDSALVTYFIKTHLWCTCTRWTKKAKTISIFQSNLVFTHYFHVNNKICNEETVKKRDAFLELWSPLYINIKRQCVANDLHMSSYLRNQYPFCSNVVLQGNTFNRNLYRQFNRLSRENNSNITSKTNPNQMFTQDIQLYLS